MSSMTLIYIANIAVAGFVGATALFAPQLAQTWVFQDAVQFSQVIRLVGALWLAIAALSCLGLYFPVSMSPALLVQLIYKASWLAVVFVPALIRGEPASIGMAVFFAVWVVVLPFVIPWSDLFSRSAT